MSPPVLSHPTIAAAAAALGAGPLTEQGIATHLRPLFTRTLNAPGIYLATHSLGRPLDQVQDDLSEAVALWQQQVVDAWPVWTEEENRYRAALGRLVSAPRPDCVIPRLSAGSALRSVLNMLPAGARVLTTAGEFHSIAMLLSQYAALGRIGLEVLPTQSGSAAGPAAALAHAVQAQARQNKPFSLVVVSHVFFATGLVVHGLDELARACHGNHCRLLVDTYHSLGALPVDTQAIGCDFAIGGCYKYLRGGPGAAFLYLSPEAISANLHPLDTGWAALTPEAPAFSLPSGPSLRAGGDAHLEGTPASLTYYQARSGLAFTEAIGVARLRAYSLTQLQILKAHLAARDIESAGGDNEHGAFLAVPARDAAGLVRALAEEQIVVNAREGRIRLCPDCLVTGDELAATVEALAAHRTLL